MGDSFLGHSGVCETCSRFAYVWVGPDGQRCDACHTRKAVRDAYAYNSVLAAQVYSARTADDALRLLGVEADPKDDR